MSKLRLLFRVIGDWTGTFVSDLMTRFYWKTQVTDEQDDSTVS